MAFRFRDRKYIKSIVQLTLYQSPNHIKGHQSGTAKLSCGHKMIVNGNRIKGYNGAQKKSLLCAKCKTEDKNNNNAVDTIIVRETQ